MQRPGRGPSAEMAEDSRGLLGDADAGQQAHHRPRFSLQEPKDFEEFETDDAHILETEDYYAPSQHDHYPPPTFLDRVRNVLGLRRRTSSRTSTTPHPPSPDAKWSQTLRTVFNYPPPNLELRSTAWLDGLRGLAAFEVFIYHYAREWVDRDPAWGPEKTAWTDPAWYRFPMIRTFYNSGHGGVAVFFAISGYVLSHRVLMLLAQGRHDSAYAALSSAIFRRALRLFAPAAIWTFIVMLVCWLLDGVIPKPDPYEIEPTLFLEIKYWFGKVLDMLTPINYPDRWVALMNRYSGNVTWTISLEYYGSIVVFCALLFTSRLRSFVVRQCLFYYMIAYAFVKDDWPSAQFLLGMSFADWQLHRARRAARLRVGTSPPSAARVRVRRIFFYIVFAFGWFMCGLPMSRPKAHDDPNDHSIESRPFFDIVAQPLAWMGLYDMKLQMDQNLYALGAICLLVGIGETPFLRSLLERRIPQYLGKISFGFYLVHVPVRAWLGMLDPLYFRICGYPAFVPWDEREETWQLFAVWMLRMGPAIVINLILGGLFERWVDRPTIKMAKRFEDWCLSFDDGSMGSGEELPEETRPERIAAS